MVSRKVRRKETIRKEKEKAKLWIVYFFISLIVSYFLAGLIRPLIPIEFNIELEGRPVIDLMYFLVLFGLSFSLYGIYRYKRYKKIKRIQKGKYKTRGAK